MTPAELLQAYDDQLRTDAETPSAVEVHHLGPLRLVHFRAGRGFITYRDLGEPAEVDVAAVRRLVAGALAHYEARPEIRRVEWKARGHDHAPGLADALAEHGFTAGEVESVMLGELSGLAVDVPLPGGVELTVARDRDAVREVCAMQDEVFGDHEPSDAHADAVWRRVERGDLELWAARADGLVVSAGRLEPVSGTEVAGLWGGCTREEWRGRGIYRALTAARARSALADGYRLAHSDSTAYSRPILERAGLVKVTTTTPWEWRRPRAPQGEPVTPATS